MREDRRADGCGEVIPSLVHATGETEEPFEEADGAFDAGSEALGHAEQRFVLALLFYAVATALLGNGHDRHTLRGIFEDFARPVAFVGRQGLGRMTEQRLVVLEGRAHESRLGRPLLKDLVVRDELALDLLDLDHVAELDILAGLAAYEQLGVRLENAEELLRVGNRTPVEHTFGRLPDHVPGKLLEVAQIYDQSLDDDVVEAAVTTRSKTLLEPTDEFGGPLANALDVPNDALEQRFEVRGLAPFAPGSAGDLRGRLIDPIHVHAAIADSLRVDVASLTDQSAQRPVGIPQEGGVRRPVDVGLHRGRVEPEHFAGDFFAVDGCLGKGLVQLLPRLRPDGVAQPAKRRVAHHRAVVNPRKAAQC